MPPSVTDGIFYVPGRLPSLNDYIREERGSRYAAAAIKRSATVQVYAAILASRLEPVATPITLICDWWRADRRTDPDNLAWAVKFILDGMIMGGILENDGWKQVTQISHFFHLAEDSDKEGVNVTYWHSEDLSCKH